MIHFSIAYFHQKRKSNGTFCQSVRIFSQNLGISWNAVCRMPAKKTPCKRYRPNAGRGERGRWRIMPRRVPENDRGTGMKYTRRLKAPPECRSVCSRSTRHRRTSKRRDRVQRSRRDPSWYRQWPAVSKQAYPTSFVSSFRGFAAHGGACAAKSCARTLPRLRE